MSANESLTGYLTIPLQVGSSDYEGLYNLPSIEGVTLLGNKTFYELFPDFLNSFSKTYYATTQQWAAEPTLIAEENSLYVYRDYYQIDGKDIPRFKIGDGQAYLIDLPFIDAQIQAHIADTTIHITQEEREYWNAKSRIIQDGEMLIITD